MKRIFCLFLTALLILSVVGCGAAPQTAEAETSAAESSAEETVVPEAATPAPKITTPAPKTATAAPKTETAVPKTETTAPKTETAAPKAEPTVPKAEAATPKAESTAPKTETAAPKTEAAAPTKPAEDADKSWAEIQREINEEIDRGIAETMAKIEAEKGIHYEYCYRQAELINQIRRENDLDELTYDYSKQYIADQIVKDFWNQKDNLPAEGVAYMNSIWIDADDCIHNLVKKSGESRYLYPYHTSMVAGHYADDNGSYWVQLLFTDGNERQRMLDDLAEQLGPENFAKILPFMQ